MAVGTTKVVQVTNIAPQATKDQMHILFGYLGKIEDIRLYPTIRDVSCPVQSRICYIKFVDTITVGIAQHMTNTVFIDRALIVIPVQNGEIPDEYYALEMTRNGTIVPGLNLNEPKMPPHVVNSVQGTGSEQVIVTTDPHLEMNELPVYPPLPATYDSTKIEETRRTIIVLNANPTATNDEFIDFFNAAGEVKYLRTCKNTVDETSHMLIEFSDQPSVINALKLNGTDFKGSPIEIQHATQPIVKPQAKSNEAAQREIEEAMSRFKEAQNMINASIEPVIGMLTKDKRSSRRSRSRSRGRRRRSRSRSRSRRSRSRRRRSSSRSRRSRSHERRRRSKSRSRRRSPSRTRRSRSRSSRGSRRSRSKSVPKKRRNRSRGRESRARSKGRDSRARSKGRDSRAKSKERVRSKDRESRARSKDRESRVRSKSRESKARSKDRESRARSKGRESRARSKDVDTKGRDSRAKSADRKLRARSKGRDSRARSKEPESRGRSRDKERNKSRERKRSRDRKSRERDVKSKDKRDKEDTVDLLEKKRSRSRSKSRRRSRSRDRKGKDRRRSRSRGGRRRSPTPKGSRKRTRSRSKDRKRDKKDKTRDRSRSKSRSKIPRNYDEEEKGFDDKDKMKDDAVHSDRDMEEKSDNMDISNSP